MQLPFDEPGDALNRVEIVGDEIFVGDGDRVPLLEEPHQLEHTGGVDDSALEERVVRRQRSVLLSEEKVLDDERAYLVLNRLHV